VEPVRPFRHADAAPLAAALAEAFRDNPLNRAVIGGTARRRLRSNRAGMRATLAAAERGPSSIWVSATAPDPARAGLIAMPPGAWPLPPPPWSAQVRVLLGQGLATARRWADVFDALQAFGPPEPSFYLGLVGVRPADQGRGVGRALVARWIEEVDAMAAPAYLETDRSELVGFYGGFGFGSIGRTVLFGVPVHFLWRPASAARGA